MYGAIHDIRLVRDHKGNSRNYAFIMYHHHNDFKCKTHAYTTEAYKHAHGKKIKDRRVLVDFERGRTTDSFIPRRFGGTLGGEARRCART